MREDEIIIESVKLLAWLILAVIFYLWPYQKLRAFRLEQDMRSIRDDLWDYMYQKGHGFKDPAYLDMRLCFNGFIRLAKHKQVGCWYATSFIAGKWLSPPQVPTDFVAADAELKRKLTEAESQMRRRIFKFLFLESMLALVLYPVLGLIRLFSGRVLLTKCHSGKYIQRLQHHALCLGKMPLPKARMMLGLDPLKTGT